MNKSMETVESAVLTEQLADNSIFEDISNRTGGNIYISAVGPVRTGKSTFIKKFKIFRLTIYIHSYRMLNSFT